MRQNFGHFGLITNRLSCQISLTLHAKNMAGLQVDMVEQGQLGHTIIAILVIGANRTLVAKKNEDLGPIDLVGPLGLGQKLKQFFGSASARQGDAEQTAGGNRLLGQLDHVGRSRTGHGIGIRNNFHTVWNTFTMAWHRGLLSQNGRFTLCRFICKPIFGNQTKIGIALEHHFGHAQEKTGGNNTRNGHYFAFQGSGIVLGIEATVENVIAIIG